MTKNSNICNMMDLEIVILSEVSKRKTNPLRQKGDQWLPGAGEEEMENDY